MLADCHSEAINLPCGSGLTCLASIHILFHLQVGAFSDFCLKHCTPEEWSWEFKVFYLFFFEKL